MDDSDIALFTSFQLAGALKQIATKPATGALLKECITFSGLDAASARAGVGNLLYSIASSVSDAAGVHRATLARAVGSGALRTKEQVAAAIKFVNVAGAAPLVDPDFSRACGLGVAFSDEELAEHAASVVASAGPALAAERYAFPIIATLLPRMKDGDFKWADGKAAKDAFDAAVLAALGPKTAEDDARIAEAKKAGASASKAAIAATTTSTAATSAGMTSATPAPAETNPFAARDIAAARNSPRLVEEHARVLGGKVRTRFPPEPNGFLHIGHAKSMNLNFDGAFRMLGLAPGVGETIFRYDDTNPDAESIEYIRSQAENVAWMGWKPVKVTHSADYFPQLYAFALQLIRSGDAFVCHQTKDDIEASREAARVTGRATDSPWRNRPVEESLREFEAMRAGRYEEGKATLRMKIDMGSPNATLWDPVAYRIKYTPHPHSGSEWCIYPSYDYSHAIIDSLEHIDYSLCTLEFEVRRDLYYWVLEKLDIWRPHVYEFARLNITHVQLSKRKILKLVQSGLVRGWDDPRIPTINGLRRRGYTPEAINAFCRDIGVSRNDNVIDFTKLEFHIRTNLDEIAPRHFVVLHPLRVVLTNVAADVLVSLEALDFPRDAALGTHSITLTRIVYIERDDFREVDDPSYYGLAPGKVAGLRYGGYVRVTGVVRDASGAVAELHAEYDASRDASFVSGAPAPPVTLESERARLEARAADTTAATAGGKASKKGGAAATVKGNLHWVSAKVAGGEPAAVQVRLYDHLFLPQGAADAEPELNPHSETVVSAFADAALVAPGRATPGAHFQFERVGFFTADPDSRDGAPVFNLTVSLKEGTEVKKVRAS